MKLNYKAMVATTALISASILLLAAGLEATTVLVESLIKPWGTAVQNAMIHRILHSLITSTFLAAITVLVIVRHPKQ